MVIVETSVFTQLIQALLNDDDYRDLQEALINRPDLGDVIQGSGGIRKIRWNLKNTGKSGGVRVIILLGGRRLSYSDAVCLPKE